MRRERFHTVVLIGYEWSAGRRSVIALLDELIAIAGKGGRLAWLRETGDVGSRSIRGSRLSPADQDLFLADDLESVDVAFQDRGKTASRVRFHFEANRTLPVPEYVRWIAPDVPGTVVEAGTPKLLTFSIALSFYRKRLSPAERQALNEAVEAVFTEMGAVCGYATETEMPVSGADGLRSTATGEPKERFVDFDYRRWIDGVHDDNLLSPLHAELVREGLNRLAGRREFDVHQLRSGDGADAGVRVRMDRDRRSARDALHAELAPLLAPPRRSVFDQRFHLVLRPSQVEAMGGLERLERSPILHDVRELPGGLVEALELAPETPEGSVTFTAELRSLFEPIYRAAGRPERYPQEDLIGCAAFSDPREIYQRLPRVEAEEKGCTFLYTENRDEAETSQIHLLIADATARSIGQVKRLFDDWLDVVGDHREAYGTLDTGSWQEETRDGRVHLARRADLSRLRQEAINLLLVRLDELNEPRCVVAFVVLGRIGLDRYRQAAGVGSGGHSAG